MNCVIRIHIVDYEDDNQKESIREDLFAFCKILQIPPLRESRLPGGNCWEVNPNKLSERRLYYIYKALETLAVLNVHFFVESREIEDDYFLNF